MTRYLCVEEILILHEKIIEQTGGASPIRDLGMLESALAQPQMTFAGVDLYVDIIDKAAALGFSIIMNHPFLDGNKRTAHAAMEVFLLLNGFEIQSPVSEQETVILSVASGQMKRENFTEWLRQKVITKR
ncbi:MAG: Toxin Doc [Chroococcopsis gigantea SAG 12.99]|jgi:death-on-curing protein|nr:type II toxin-antitoxin system death-on-curing family toxin [Chlorogloea purpurea SAG 13.99]MDV3000266.1 Toxin Doc [Chroococcopsis gigantea SAG 12.99]